MAPCCTTMPTHAEFLPTHLLPASDTCPRHASQPSLAPSPARSNNLHYNPPLTCCPATATLSRVAGALMTALPLPLSLPIPTDNNLHNNLPKSPHLLPRRRHPQRSRRRLHTSQPHRRRRPREEPWCQAHARAPRRCPQGPCACPCWRLVPTAALLLRLCCSSRRHCLWPWRLALPAVHLRHMVAVMLR